MVHVAIMRKSWGLLPRISSGEKTIESRWYFHRAAPWGRAKAGEAVYFKNSGEPVTLRAEIGEVLEFSDLTPSKVRSILREYGERDGLRKDEIRTYHDMFKDKRYCILLFLKNPKPVKPFDIDKKGFGAMSAWICAPSLAAIKA